MFYSIPNGVDATAEAARDSFEMLPPKNKESWPRFLSRRETFLGLLQKNVWELPQESFLGMGHFDVSMLRKNSIFHCHLQKEK